MPRGAPRCPTPVRREHVGRRDAPGGSETLERVAEERRVKEAVTFVDPVGNPLEAFYGPEIASEPFRPSRAISGFRTGPLGLGHVVKTVDRIDDVVDVIQEIDANGVSTTDEPVGIAFAGPNRAFVTLGVKPVEWRERLCLYPPILDLFFGRSLHFVARLDVRQAT